MIAEERIEVGALSTMGLGRAGLVCQIDRPFRDTHSLRPPGVTALHRRVRQLEREVSERDAFLCTLAHELRHPVAPVFLHAHALLGRLRAAGPEATFSAGELLPSFELFASRLDRFRQGLNRLLDAGQIDRQGLELLLEEVDLVEVVRDVAAASFHDGGSFTLKAAAPIVGRWDRLRLTQIVANLLSNAIRFGQGKPIVVRVQQDAGAAILVVRDEGVGIPKAQQRRIFERFKRGPGARRGSGLGIGLWMVKRIVDAHGGSVGVASAPGRGATFTVRLPHDPRA